MDRKPNLFQFILAPLFRKEMWLGWTFALIIILGLSDGLMVARMKIPSEGTVHRISGMFIDTTEYSRKGHSFRIGIKDAAGAVHTCTCRPQTPSACVAQRAGDHKDLRAELDSEILAKFGAEKAVIKWMAGKEGELWLYPTPGVFSQLHVCYHISTSDRVMLPFEKSVQVYTDIKSGYKVYALYLILVLSTVLFSFYLFVRISQFIEIRRLENMGSSTREPN